MKHPWFWSWLCAPLLLVGCASFAGIKERYAVCSYDDAWEAAVASIKDRSISVENKDKGVIQTAWIEVPMPGRTFGAFQRNMKDSKDRSRVKMTVTRMNDVTQVTFNEERERWGFRGGSRLFGWSPTEPSEEVVNAIQSKLDTKLKEQGCPIT